MWAGVAALVLVVGKLHFPSRAVSQLATASVTSVAVIRLGLVSYLQNCADVATGLAGRPFGSWIVLPVAGGSGLFPMAILSVPYRTRVQTPVRLDCIS